MWVELWVRLETAQIHQQYQGMMADTPSASAHQPQHQRQQQSAEKQAYNSDNYDLDRIHDASVAQPQLKKPKEPGRRQQDRDQQTSSNKQL